MSGVQKSSESSYAATAPDHDPETCAYCENNFYDSESCDECGGTGGTSDNPCPECCGHGFVGYSW